MRSGALLTALGPEAVAKFQKMHEPTATVELRAGGGKEGEGEEGEEVKEVDPAVKKDN